MSKVSFRIPGDSSVYWCPVSAESVVLGKFVEAWKYQKEKMPESMRKLVKVRGEDERRLALKEIDDVEYSHKHVPYMAGFVSLMCGISVDKIINGHAGFKGMAVNDLEILFGNCSRSVSVFNIDEDFKSFEFEGVEYLLPEKFMEKSTVIEYMEAAQYQAYYSKLEGGMWEALSFVIAIICRPEGVKYDEGQVLINGEAFKNLSLEVAMNVSFFLMRLSRKLGKDFLFFSLAQALGQSKRG